MSLTVSFPVMIHLKSTLAISAIMLTGLVAASPFPYASDHEPRQPRRTASMQIAPAVEAAASPAAVTSWADPPVKQQAAVEAPLVLAASDTGAPTAQESTPSAVTVAPPPVRHVSLQASAQKAEQARRRKIARAAAARERQAVARQTAPSGDEAQVSPTTAPNTSQRIDPIGNILRGLGIGKQG
ncbi:hypothetical protein [Methylobacterium haplocladii]|uniref:Uncharacterized protein n=1 Tax=Methylobacterium haplocladii TaxID=1176176 RepID=A0A512ITE5_9HYPH|nr:hypothetical protein [Methylobacterium haplocladii]GEP00985.1 hypothetical protein MHA02_33720 [Methylobacterium haplocladii]GLS58331.1 hypothetical protein GCM10007887_09900 [Methylobacterium haplocladii]